MIKNFQQNKITSIILTFGMLFILSCFSMYNIYWRRQVMRDEDYSLEVERVPGMSDKPPPYDSLSFSRIVQNMLVCFEDFFFILDLKNFLNQR